MTSTPQRIDRPLLHAARDALGRRDFQRADALFRQHMASAREDAEGLAEYGVFSLRTGRADTACWLLSKADALHPGQAAWLAQLGYACIGTGDHAAAGRHFRAALATAPGDAPANYGLGLCHQHDGQWAAAETAFARALASTEGRDGFPILLHLAEASQRAGDHATAAAHFERAARMAPDDPALLYARARFLREHGDASQAMALVDRCAQRTPDEPRIVLEKARCLRAVGDAARALAWLERLERLSPGLAETHEEWGSCLEGAARETQWIVAVDAWMRKGDQAAAEALLDRLLEANPGSAAGWNSRGILESARQRHDAAEAAWLKAIACDPSQLDAAANLALLYEASNRLDDAQRIAQTAAAHIGPGKKQDAAIEIHLVLCKLARRRGDIAAALAELDCLEALSPNDARRMHASFERGRLLDRRGDAAGAMAAFTLGNRLALASWQRDNPGRNKALAGVGYMLDLAGKGWLQSWKPVTGLPAHRDLAFLIGFPRSGTTLLNQVLDGHPSIHAVEEKPLVQRMLDRTRAMPEGYPHALPEFDAFDIGWLREAYFREAALHGADASAALLLDKFPMNTTLAGLLHRVFPQARFVFALRHPCDVVLSCFMQGFGLNNTMANFCTLADTVALYTRTMDLWQFYRDQLPLQVHVIRYEDVVDDFDGQVRALCAFLGVPWQDGLRDFSARALDRGKIHTPSYEQVSRPIYREARYRWERYREFLEPFLPALRPYIERFGYAAVPAAANE